MYMHCKVTAVSNDVLTTYVIYFSRFNFYLSFSFVVFNPQKAAQPHRLYVWQLRKRKTRVHHSPVMLSFLPHMTTFCQLQRPAAHQPSYQTSSQV